MTATPSSICESCPSFKMLVKAVKTTYKVMATRSPDGMHISFSFLRLYDGTGYDTKKQAYNAAILELETSGYNVWAFLLKLDLGRGAE